MNLFLTLKIQKTCVKIVVLNIYFLPLGICTVFFFMVLNWKYICPITIQGSTHS